MILDVFDKCYIYIYIYKCGFISFNKFNTYQFSAYVYRYNKIIPGSIEADTHQKGSSCKGDHKCIHTYFYIYTICFCFTMTLPDSQHCNGPNALETCLLR